VYGALIRWDPTDPSRRSIGYEYRPLAAIFHVIFARDELAILVDGRSRARSRFPKHPRTAFVNTRICYLAVCGEFAVEHDGPTKPSLIYELSDGQREMDFPWRSEFITLFTSCSSSQLADTRELFYFQRQLNVHGYECSSDLRYVLFRHNVKPVSSLGEQSLSARGKSCSRGSCSATFRSVAYR